MKISKKKAKALYSAIHDPILQRRLAIMLPKNGNVMYVPLKLDETLLALETAIWKKVCAALDIEVDCIAEKEE